MSVCVREIEREREEGEGERERELFIVCAGGSRDGELRREKDR